MIDGLISNYKIKVTKKSIDTKKYKYKLQPVNSFEDANTLSTKKEIKGNLRESAVRDVYRLKVNEKNKACFRIYSKSKKFSLNIYDSNFQSMDCYVNTKEKKEYVEITTGFLFEGYVYFSMYKYNSENGKSTPYRIKSKIMKAKKCTESEPNDIFPNVIKLGRTYTAKIEPIYQRDRDIFKVNIPSDGTYRVKVTFEKSYPKDFWSFDCSPAYPNNQEFASENDLGQKKKNTMEYELKAGEYYIRINAYTKYKKDKDLVKDYRIRKDSYKICVTKV